MRPFEIQAKCEMAADAIATLAIGNWAGWVLYILEALEDLAGNRDTFGTEVLESMAESINTRLNEGRW